jgi:hypothetical protein
MACITIERFLTVNISAIDKRAALSPLVLKASLKIQFFGVHWPILLDGVRFNSNRYGHAKYSWITMRIGAFRQSAGTVSVVLTHQADTIHIVL